jgi:hypothetical protein
MMKVITITYMAGSIWEKFLEIDHRISTCDQSRKMSGITTRCSGPRGLGDLHVSALNGNLERKEELRAGPLSSKPLDGLRLISK